LPELSWLEYNSRERRGMRREQMRNGNGYGHGHGDVLVVDDDAGCRDLMSELLESVGYRTMVADTGE
jgi:response regulator RpfG family c-di-GMP phosphodiesterase